MPLLRVMRSDRLPLLHAALCRRLVRSGYEGRIVARARLVPRSAPARVLVPPGTDICAAENYGVRAR